jgi:microcystin-dependent protein
MSIKFTNNAVGFLATTLAADGTTFGLLPGQGDEFPVLNEGDWCPGTLVSSDSDVEIVRVTQRVEDTFTVMRAQEGTQAIDFSPGDRFELRMTAAIFEKLSAAIEKLQPRIGDIKQWHGVITDIETVHGPGWQLADGTNGTHDLRDKFIVAAGGKYTPGDTGGAETVSLTTAQMAAHNHAMSDPGHAHGVSDPTHAHSVYDPGHTHGHNTAALTPSSTGGGAFQINGYAGGTISAAATGIGIYGAATGISIAASGTGITTQNAGLGQAHENRPPYFALAFIEYTGIGVVDPLGPS